MNDSSVCMESNSERVVSLSGRLAVEDAKDQPTAAAVGIIRALSQYVYDGTAEFVYPTCLATSAARASATCTNVTFWSSSGSRGKLAAKHVAI